jgi:hypothetical protein
MNVTIVYRENGVEKRFVSSDMEEVLTKIDEIQYILKGAELISVTNNGTPVPIPAIRGW